MAFFFSLFLTDGAMMCINKGHGQPDVSNVWVASDLVDSRVEWPGRLRAISELSDSQLCHRVWIRVALALSRARWVVAGGGGGRGVHGQVKSVITM